MDDETPPDHSDDPRGTDTGDGGYGEDQPREVHGDQKARRRESSDGDDAPSTSHEDEGDAGQATGNPGGSDE